MKQMTLSIVGTWLVHGSLPCEGYCVSIGQCLQYSFLGLQGKRFDQDVEARDCKVCVWPVGVDVVFPVNREKTKQGGDKRLQVGQVVFHIIWMKHFNVSCRCV